MILVLFFTRGVSLETWVDTGLFDREKLIYEEHLKQGHLERVFWLTYGSDDAEIARKLHAEKRLHPGIRVIQMPGVFRGRVGKLIYSFLIPTLQKKYLKQADIYKTNQMDGSWSAVFAKWLYNKPLIVRTGYTLSLFSKRLNKSKLRIAIYQLIERLVYRYATLAVVTSEKDKKYLNKQYSLPDNILKVLPNFIDTNFFVPKETEKCPDRIIFVGRLSKEKNLSNLISAIAKTDMTLDIYGKGELREELEEHAKKQGARVNFMGTVPNSKLPDVLNRYKYFILPSYFEGMPKSLLEAMACGLVCIGTDVEGINELIEDGVNGVSIHGVEWKNIHAAIEKIKDTPKKDLDIFSANVHKLVLKNYSLIAVTEKEFFLFKSL